MEKLRKRKPGAKALAVLLLTVLLFQAAGCQFLDIFKNPVETGLECLKEKEYDGAVEAFQEAIEKEKQPGEAYRGIGIAYWEQGKYPEAKEAFINALTNGAKKTGTIYNFLGICSLKEENLDEALSYFETGVSLEGEGELRQEMEFNIISIYEKKLDWENAKTKMEAYIAKYPDDEKAVKEAEFLKTR